MIIGGRSYVYDFCLIRLWLQYYHKHDVQSGPQFMHRWCTQRRPQISNYKSGSNLTMEIKCCNTVVCSTDLLALGFICLEHHIGLSLGKRKLIYVSSILRMAKYVLGMQIVPHDLCSKFMLSLFCVFLIPFFSCPYTYRHTLHSSIYGTELPKQIYPIYNFFFPSCNFMYDSLCFLTN